MAKPIIGGQAVIEGVMMRSPKSFAVAVRRPDGSIVVREAGWLSFAERFPFLRWPLLRGANMLIESMANGISALNFSASQAMPDEADVAGSAEPEAPGGSSSSNPALFVTLAISLASAVLLFKGIPHLATWGLGALLGSGGESALPMDGPGFHLVDGLLRLGIFVVYILLISRLDDVRRLFMYHGAEHKSVHSWENDAPLDVEHTRPQSTAHPRCGTSLILLVIAVSVFVFAATLPFLPKVSEHTLVQTLFAFAVKVPLLLPIAGLAYEAQRLAAKHPGNPLVRALIAPGMLMQRLTTREPGDRELEVALTALRKTVWRERLAQGVAAGTVPGPATEAVGDTANIEIYETFDEVERRVAA
ncbi:MAG: DUF1385 domain-containing protein [Myxococcota bacterium]